MRISCVILDYQKPYGFDRTIAICESVCSVRDVKDVHVICQNIDVKGIGAACNKALKMSFDGIGADYCLILANDIKEPENAIELRLNAIANTEGEVGICVIPCDRQSKRESVWVASNYMISRKLWEKIGYFTEEWDKTYGPIDLHYSTRSYLAGFKNINVLGARAEHLDNGDTAYGFSKREKLNTSMKEFRNWYNNIIQHPNPKLYLEP